MPRKIPAFLHMAADLARPYNGDHRAYFIGALARRRDGALVHARNGSTQTQNPACHAEARVLSRAGTAPVELWVARTKSDLSFGLARPCVHCMARIRARGVERVIYSIDEHEYGVLVF